MKKKLHLETLRIVAAILVIFNHTEGFRLFMNFPVGSVMYCISLFFSALCKIAVPIFLMISGALMLNRDISLKEIWLKRIPRILIVLVISSFVYYLYGIKDSLSSFSVLEFLQVTYSSQTSVHLWYLYAYIAFLASIPFLRAITKALSDTAFRYMIVLYGAFMLVSLLEILLLKVSINKYLKPSWLFGEILLFPLLGYYIEHRQADRKLLMKDKLLLIFVGLLGILSAAWLTSWEFVSTNQFTQSYISFLVFLPCLSLYLLIKDFFSGREVHPIREKILVGFGACTFGVYLIHLIVPLRSTITTILYEKMSLPPLLAVLAYCIIIFVESSCITFVLKKLPFVKKLL